MESVVSVVKSSLQQTGLSEMPEGENELGSVSIPHEAFSPVIENFTSANVPPQKCESNERCNPIISTTTAINMENSFFISLLNAICLQLLQICK